MNSYGKGKAYYSASETNETILQWLIGQLKEELERYRPGTGWHVGQRKSKKAKLYLAEVHVDKDLCRMLLYCRSRS